MQQTAIAFLLTTSLAAAAQVAPLAPKWLAGTPPPPVETFADGLTRRNIPLTEPELLAALKNPDPEIRSLAAAQLAASDDHPALKYMITAFQDERDPQVQVNIAGAASWLGSNIAIQQLKNICRDVNQPSTARLDAARYISNKQLPDASPQSGRSPATTRTPPFASLPSPPQSAIGASPTAHRRSPFRP